MKAEVLLDCISHKVQRQQVDQWSYWVLSESSNTHMDWTGHKVHRQKDTSFIVDGCLNCQQRIQILSSADRARADMKEKSEIKNTIELHCSRSICKSYKLPSKWTMWLKKLKLIYPHLLLHSVAHITGKVLYTRKRGKKESKNENTHIFHLFCFQLWKKQNGWQDDSVKKESG